MGVDPSILGNVDAGEAQLVRFQGGGWKLFFSTPRFEPRQTRKKRFRARRLARGRHFRELCLCQDSFRSDTRYTVVINELQATRQSRGTERKGRVR